MSLPFKNIANNIWEKKCGDNGGKPKMGKPCRPSAIDIDGCVDTTRILLHSPDFPPETEYAPYSQEYDYSWPFPDMTEYMHTRDGNHIYAKGSQPGIRSYLLPDFPPETEYSPSSPEYGYSWPLPDMNEFMRTRDGKHIYAKGSQPGIRSYLLPDFPPETEYSPSSPEYEGSQPGIRSSPLSDFPPEHAPSSPEYVPYSPEYDHSSPDYGPSSPDY